MGREARKRYVYVILLCLSVNLLAGCKEKTVDYDMEEVTESTQEGNSESSTAGRGKKGLKQFADVKYWKEGWEWKDEEGEEYGEYMDVDIFVPDAEQMSVVEVKELEFDTAYKKQLTEHIFGDGEIYYGDVEYLPKKELEERYEYYEKMRQADLKDGTDWEKKLSTYENALKTAGETYKPADGYGAAAYLGTYAGSSYELSFLEYDMGEVPDAMAKYQRFRNEHPFVKSDDIQNKDGFVTCCRCKEISLVSRDLLQFCPEEVKEVENLNYKALERYSAVENKCKLSEEVAREQAERFIDELKLDYSAYVYAEPLGWWTGTGTGNDVGNYVADGYVFTFDAGIDSVSFTRYGTQETDRNFSKEKKESKEVRYSMNARLEVCINDKGIIEMRAQNPIETLGVSGEIEMLPINVIQEIMKAQIELPSEPISADRMELIYLRIRDKENEGYFSYVPVWRMVDVWFHDGDGYVFAYGNQILINAIDGSVIDFYEEA